MTPRKGASKQIKKCHCSHNVGELLQPSPASEAIMCAWPDSSAILAECKEGQHAKLSQYKRRTTYDQEPGHSQATL